MIQEWNKEKYEKMKGAWERFIIKGIINDEIVRPIIAKSWIRSRKYGVDPTADLSMSDTFDISDRLKKSSTIVNAARPPIIALHQMVRGTGFRINLTDSEGYFLISEGDEDVLQKTTILNRHIGICRNEQKVGTCGISLSLVEDKPVQVNSFEHFNSFLHEWTCSSAPIHDLKGNIVGVLNISGHHSLVHRHTLGMVVGIVRAIELALMNEQTIKDLNHYRDITNLIIQEVYEGLVVFNDQGNLSHSNKKGLEILAAMVGRRNIMNINSLNTVNEILEIDREIIDKEVSTVINGKRQSFYLTTHFIGDDNRRENYKCIFFKDPEKVHKITRRIIYGERAFYTFDDIIGTHDTILKAIQDATLAAPTRAPVLIVGETGSGKEMFAQAIHNASDHQAGPFVAINCGAIPADLIESELFGYEAGAFTGARRGGKPGKIEMADGGTLFLDELDSMPSNMQIKLLRVLETGLVNRIGGYHDIPVNVRVISASKRDFLEEIKKGTFRNDLFFRVNTITINLPPLQDRKSDIPILCDFFLKRLISRNYKPIRGITSDTYKLLESYSWPGNVRELESCIGRAYVFEEGNYITSKSLPSYIFDQAMVPSAPGTSPKMNLRDYERDLIYRTLRECKGNISQVSRILGIGRDTIYRKIRKYSVKK
jgi:transcriptional regulator of acetoin/glycerol metabolism